MAVGLFASSGDIQGLFHGGGFALRGAQLMGVGMCVAFAFATGWVVWFALAKTTGVRVSLEHEIEGLDLAECGVEAYGREAGGFHVLSDEDPSGGETVAREPVPSR
ncbi:MAG: hypothetical protein R3B82_06635 [Sandaracinaceae bacterium]